MNKTIKRGLSLVLCLVIVLSLSTGAFAATKYKSFDSLFSIGDSNAMGYGLKGYKDYENRDYLHGLKGSYTAYIRDYLDLSTKKCNTMTYPGMRSKDALYYLGGSVDMTGDSYFAKFSTQSWPESLITDNGTKGKNFQNQIKNGGKSLILLATGPADVFYSATQTTIYSSNYSNKLLAAAALPGVLEKNYDEFVEYFPKLIKRIQKLNPEATILIVSYYNPLKNLKLTDLSLTSIFDSMSFISENMNAKFKEWAKQYKCLYADITNVETYTLERSLTFSDLISSGNGKIYHMTADGHKYTARQILNQIKAKPDKVTTKLTVDLGSVTSVSQVKLDNVVVSDFTYTASNHKLIVPCSVKTAKSLVVTEVFKDGNTYVADYELIWEADTGYIAHCKSMNKNAVVIPGFSGGFFPSGFDSGFLNTFFSFFSSFFDVFSNILNILPIGN